MIPLLTLGGALAASPVHLAAEGAGPPVAAALHFNLDESLDLAPLGDRLVQLTPAGVLLIRDQTLDVVQALVTPGEARRISAGTDCVWVATETGHALRLSLDKDGLARLEERRRFEGWPLWIGEWQGQPWVISSIERSGPGGFQSTPLAGGRVQTWAGPDTAPITHLVRFQVVEGQLWASWDAFELGGAVARVDPRRGRMDRFVRTEQAVSGLTSFNGEILAYGGHRYYLAEQAIVWAVGADGLDPRYHVRWDAAEDIAEPDTPPHQLTALLPTGEGLLLASESEVWLADAALADWRSLGELGAAPHGRKPLDSKLDWVVAAVQTEQGPVLATRYTGLLRWRDGALQRSPVAPGLPFAPDGLLAAPGGLAVSSNGDNAARWDGQSWQLPPALPEGEYSAVGFPKWFNALDGTLWRARETLPCPKGDCALVLERWDSARLEPVTRLDPGVAVPPGVITKAGDRWIFLNYVETGDRNEHRVRVSLLEQGELRALGEVSGMSYRYSRLVPGTEDLLLDPDYGQLLRIQPDQDPPLEILHPRSARDGHWSAAALPNGEILLADEVEVLRLDRSGQDLEILTGTRDVRAATVDGCGRVWLGGDSLWVWGPVGGLTDMLQGLPQLQGRHWRELAAMPTGVAASDWDSVVELTLPCAAP